MQVLLDALKDIRDLLDKEEKLTINEWQIETIVDIALKEYEAELLNKEMKDE